MPAVLPIIFMIGLIIWSLPVSAQKAQRFGPFDWRTGHSATDDWISLWVLENFADNVDLDEVELLEPQEFSRIKRSKSAQIGQPQPTSSLADDNVKLMQQLEATSTVLAIIDTQAAKTAMEKEILAAKAEQDRQHIAALESELSKSREMNSILNHTNEQLIAEKDELRQRSRQRIAALESELGASRKMNKQLNRANEQLIAEKETLQPRSGWIAQLLGYHRGYIDAASNVEISAREERESKALTKRLETALGRDFAVPDLAAFGMVFVGGHVAPINGVATGRIVYRNTDDNTLEFWLVPRRGQSSGVNFAQNGELNIVHWQGNDSEYALIGSVAWGELAPIAGKLHQLYAE